MSHHPLPDLHALGYRLTPQRRLIWDVLHQSQSHLTAEEIQARIPAPCAGLNRPTIYRNLQLLRQLGLVRDLQIGGGPARYETVQPGEEHHHLICRACGAIANLTDLDLLRALQRLGSDQGFGGETTDLVIYRDCARCQTQEHAARADVC